MIQRNGRGHDRRPCENTDDGEGDNPESSVNANLQGESDVIRVENANTRVSLHDQDLDEENRGLIWRKRVNTIFLGLSFACFGLTYALLGPSLLDLNHIINVDIEGGAILFTSLSIGYLAGCLTCGIVIEKFNQDILMFLSTFTMGAFFIFIPWAKVKAVMAVMNSLYAFSAGAIDTAVNSVCMRIWGVRAGPYMQAIYFLFSLGGLLGPLIVEPFLMDKASTTSLSQANYSEFSKATTYNSEVLRLDAMTRQTETNVYIAFLICGLMTVVASFPFIYLYIKNKPHGSWKKDIQEEQQEGRKVHTLFGKTVYLILLSLFFLIHMNIEDASAMCYHLAP